MFIFRFVNFRCGRITGELRRHLKDYHKLKGESISKNTKDASLLSDLVQLIDADTETTNDLNVNCNTCTTTQSKTETNYSELATPIDAVIVNKDADAVVIPDSKYRGLNKYVGCFRAFMESNGTAIPDQIAKHVMKFYNEMDIIRFEDFKASTIDKFITQCKEANLKPGTIKSYLFSLRNYVIYANRMGWLSDVLSFTNAIKEKLKRLSDENQDRIVARCVISNQTMLTQEDRRFYLRGQYVKDVTAGPTYDYVKLRNYLLTVITMRCATRPSVLMNMLTEDVLAATASEEEGGVIMHTILCRKHKTSRVYGPAAVPVMTKTYHLLLVSTLSSAFSNLLIMSLFYVHLHYDN